MRLMFVNWAFETHGSAQDIYNYTRVARNGGHEVALYGRPVPGSAFNYSLDVTAADAVVFIFEFTTRLDCSEKMGLLRMLDRAPRKRRLVIDCDGKYNAAIHVGGDYNHVDETESRHWMEVCDSLSDKILQPTFHPLQPNVRPFFFHAYNPGWEQPLDFRAKEYGMYYVGNNWFRWRPLCRVLQALEPIRGQVGRIGLVGHGWNSDASWGGPAASEEAYFVDSSYLRKLEVEVMAPIRFDQVVPSMGRGVLTPVIYRPLFDYLHLVTCRTFETPAANTIPIFGQDSAYVREIFGESALALVLPQERPEEKILALLGRPQDCVEIIWDIRRRMADHYSYSVQFRKLMDFVES